MDQDYAYKAPRLYVASDLREGGEVLLPEGQAHYLRNVLRKQPGDFARIFNGRDGEWAAEIADLGKKAGTAVLRKKLREQPEKGPPVRLIFAPIKKARMDFLIEKAVELGVDELHPVLTARTEARSLKDARLEAQMIEAAEQCERMDVPRLYAPEPLAAKLAGWKHGAVLAALEREDAPFIGEGSAAGLSFLIGPEGGFTEDEARTIRSSPHIRPVSLGQRILRAETAALFCLSFAAVAVSKGA